MREPPCAAGSATDPNPNHNPNQEWIVKESRYEKTLEEEDLFLGHEADAVVGLLLGAHAEVGDRAGLRGSRHVAIDEFKRENIKSISARVCRWRWPLRV